MSSDEFWHQHKFSASINSIKCLQCIQSLPEIVPLGHEESNISSKQPIAKRLKVERQCSHNKHDHTNFFENKVICSRRSMNYPNRVRSH